VRAALRPGIRILDAGSGRHPALAVGDRPQGCLYVGLDISEEELAAAPPGTYDELHVGDVTQRIPSLEGSFDLVLCFQVLEHVRPLDDTLEHFRAYLVPGGHCIAQFSGAWSIFAVVNRLVPHRVVVWALVTLLHRPARSVFPAPYHHCSYSDLRRLLRPWSHGIIRPRFTGAAYLRFVPPLQRLYLVFEEWALRTRRWDLATHYLIDVVR
jgi:SAM-dependent methyltransferase